MTDTSVPGKDTAPIAQLVEDDDLLHCADEQPDHYRASLDITARSADFCSGITEAIHWYELARNRLPRDWDQLTDDAEDRRAALAVIASLTAIRQKMDETARFYTLAARETGATWQQIADATEQYSTGSDIRAEFIEEARAYDWPGETAALVQQLSSEDPPPPSIHAERFPPARRSPG